MKEENSVKKKMSSILSPIFFVFCLAQFCCAGNNPRMICGRRMGDSQYGTHMTPLFTAVVNTDGPVLELGCGDFSTPMLHALCSVKKRFLLSAESNKNWQKLFFDLKREWHKFKYVSSVQDWANVGSGINWSVVLVDHAPGEQRIVDIERLRPNTEIFVIHDTEDPVYGYEPLLSTFKYKYTYKRYNTTTMLVSDVIDVAALFVD